MAIGTLKNSNATLALSVTGNAMPLNGNEKQLGEVFVGIAGYVNNNTIIYYTTSINPCVTEKSIRLVCDKWYTTIHNDPTMKTHNTRMDTAAVSKLIRLYTTSAALTLCGKFLEKHTLIVPTYVKRVKFEQNDGLVIKVPKNKYESRGSKESCVDNKNCECSKSCTRCGTFLYKPMSSKKLL